MEGKVGAAAPTPAGTPSSTPTDPADAPSPRAPERTHASARRMFAPQLQLSRRFADWIRSAPGLTFLVIGALTILGAVVRLEELGQTSLWVDEAQTTLVAFSVLQHGYPVIVAHHIIDNWEPLYPYLEAFSIRLLGQSNFAYRVPSALAGTALIPLAYVIGARLRDRYVGITFAAMVAFSTEYIGWSRQARWYMLLVLLMALAFLFALMWYQSENRRKRWWNVGAAAFFAGLAATASIGVFLLYVPGAVAAGLVYSMVSRWEEIRAFFGRPAKGSTDATRPPARFVPYPLRPLLVVAPIAAAVAVAILDPAFYTALYVATLTPVFGFTPNPPVWSANIPTYLLDYYPGVVAAGILGGVFAVVRRDRFEIALVAFCAASLASVSVGASFATDISGGGPSYPRHLVPLLYFLFLLVSLGLVEAVQRAFRAAPGGWRLPKALRTAKPALAGVAVVAMLVLPCLIVPSGENLYLSTQQSPADSLVPWVAFSLYPAHPSSLYGTDQANYQLASDYVASHRNATDIVAATDCGPPAVYLGSVQYWIRGNPRTGQIIHVEGNAEFFQTGSVLVSNTSELEALLYEAPGWLVSDQPTSARAVFPSGMSLVLTYFMTEIPSASDNSIWLYHWNLSTPVSLLEMLSARDPTLKHFDGNLTRLANFATIGGVTSSPLRDLLLPMEAALLPYVAPGILPLAILVNVYNHRPDLQTEFPQMLQNSSNDTPLIQWAYEVASGQLPDPAQSVLAPYAAWYQSHT